VDATTITVLLFLGGLALLVAEIFLPSHAMLSLAGLGLLIAGIARVFMAHGETAGFFSIIGTLIVLPVLAVIAVKFWHRTPLGKRISPPNPTVGKGEAFSNDDELRALIGRFGRAMTPLRPVGSCEFGGRRVECVAEFAMIDIDQPVEATGQRGRMLVVRPRAAGDQAAAG